MTGTNRPLGVHPEGDRAGSPPVPWVGARRATAPQADLDRSLARLGREIQEDQGTLHEVMGRMNGVPAALREAAAAVTATLGRWTLRLQHAGNARSLIGLESLSLGIEGKASLWRALREVAVDDPRSGDIDFESLIARAESQRDDLERQRLAAGRAAKRPSAGRGR